MNGLITHGIAKYREDILGKKHININIEVQNIEIKFTQLHFAR